MGGLTGRLIGAAVLTGLLAGAGGIALTLMLHGVQHLAFGYTEATFLIGVERASAARRVLAMTLGGLIVGLGWWWLRARAPMTTSVRDALDDPTRSLRLPRTTADAVLQIVAVGFGASLGREGAPRQVGAALAGRLAQRLDLTVPQRRTILACGAGAGLAAVYNVPLGGALFTLEILLVSIAVKDLVPALLSCTIAAAVAWPVLADPFTYLVAPQQMHAAVLVWSLLIGPVAAVVGRGFHRLTAAARPLAPSGWRLPVTTTLVFAAVGALAIPFPQLLGNGKGPTQLALDGSLGVGVLIALLLLKPLVTAGCLASGAQGGLLTPAAATGALLGALTGAGWSALWPGAPIAAYAMIGAAAVLATTQRAPLCAVVLVLEFTRTGLDLLVPMLLAVGGAAVTSYLLGRSRPHAVSD
ncbi:MAG: chloride channel protein [Nakamurella sp.]